jgi:flagellar biosynthesis protein FlhG
LVIETSLLSKTQKGYETEPETLKELRKKSVAVASGKGGVGKSTTALNLAVYFAKAGMKVALLDMDPLSNIATILDLEINGTFPEETNVPYDTIPLSGCIQPVFTNLDLLFPRPKFRKGESLRLLLHVFTQYREELNNRYDLFLYDLPAGVGQEENLTLLSYVDHLIIVTNAEPPAHVSAGGYIKAVLETAPHVRLYFWHNKYSLVQENGFNPLQVIENYNRQVPEELRIDRTKLQSVKNIAFIPQDPSLDLLQSNLSLRKRPAETSGNLRGASKETSCRHTGHSFA